jgi:hypothetical protein
MISLGINSSTRYAGKTLIAMGLALKLKKDGYKIGYLKSLGNRPIHQAGVTTDQDVLFMKELLDINAPIEHICPIVLSQDVIQAAYQGVLPDLKKKIQESIDCLSKDKDLFIIEGPGSLFEGGFLGISTLELLDLLSLKVLLIDSYSTDIEAIDFFLLTKGLLKEALLGIILNRIPPLKLDYVKEKVVPFLLQKEIPVLGLIPEDKILGSVSVDRLAELLDGKVISGKDQLHKIVGDFTVGAMGVERALKYFRRLKNPAVITSGDRVDIQLAAMETGASCLILTEGFAPKDEIVHKAQTEGIPLILVEDETIIVVEKVDTILKGLEFREKEKVSRVIELLEREIDFAAFYRKLWGSESK